MKTRLTSTALMLALAGAAAAQSETSPVGVTKMSEGSLLVGDMIGEPIMCFRGVPNTDAPMPLSGLNRLEKVAHLTDVMINADGTVGARVMSVVGFLGLADREVTVAMEGVTVVMDVRGDKHFVIYAYEHELCAAPRFNMFDIE